MLQLCTFLICEKLTYENSHERNYISENFRNLKSRSLFWTYYKVFKESIVSINMFSHVLWYEEFGNSKKCLGPVSCRILRYSMYTYTLRAIKKAKHKIWLEKRLEIRIWKWPLKFYALLFNATECRWYLIGTISTLISWY